MNWLLLIPVALALTIKLLAISRTDYQYPSKAPLPTVVLAISLVWMDFAELFVLLERTLFNATHTSETLLRFYQAGSYWFLTSCLLILHRQYHPNPQRRHGLPLGLYIIAFIASLPILVGPTIGSLLTTLNLFTPTQKQANTLYQLYTCTLLFTCTWYWARCMCSKKNWLRRNASAQFIAAAPLISLLIVVMIAIALELTIRATFMNALASSFFIWAMVWFGLRNNLPGILGHWLDGLSNTRQMPIPLTKPGQPA